GAVPTAADVGVRDGKVAAIARGLPEGARTVDASGQWVMPGLIDVHTHGYLRNGKRADIAVINPAGFGGSSAAYAEAPYPGAPDVTRMVNRNDNLVAATIVGGQIVYAEGEFAPGFGSKLEAGRFLEAGNR
ncbi:MAG TPA: hypothetical protein VH084_16120, partial [Mycobacterium sp.]|nr:hypothetical protein [Mycobacterium sp.]